MQRSKTSLNKRSRASLPRSSKINGDVENAEPEPKSNGYHNSSNDQPSRLRVLELELRRQGERLGQVEHQLQSLIKEQDGIQLEVEDLRDQLQRTGLSEAPRSAYQHLLRGIRQVVSKYIPRYSTIVVASKGDQEILNLNGRTGWHFPQNSEGKYAGYYPDCSLGAIAQLEALRAQGGQYFLLPATAFWWLDHYLSFRQHLERRYQLVFKSEETCVIYSLANSSCDGHGMAAQFADLVGEFQERFGRIPAVLDWRSGIQLSALLPHCKIFHPRPNDGPLPYLDGSVDLIVTNANDPSAVSEAWRVATGAVITVKHEAAEGEPKLSIHWLSNSPGNQFKSVSIIIPCYNGCALTNACLASLSENLPPQFSGEIIVVDDASTDGTQELLEDWVARDSRVKVLRNRKNLGFVDTCNRGAREAVSEILIFLNNDVVLLPGWLPPLLHLFRDFPRAGAAGGKLILPDGTLQEAGGSVFSDGSAMNFGRGDTKLDAALYNYVREVDYCSGALLATPRALFEELGGFDLAYRPGYYEDTDYCFKVRSKGYAVYYQPETAVVHREGGTAGTDVAVGMKRYQLINQSKFVESWGDALKHHPARPNKVDSLALQALATRDY